ncbi:ATRX regulator, partial [Amia calva]|nr:ATRX regulator [Amia calva]
MSDDISKDGDGMDEQCRWCAEGGNLICCDFCHNAFCKKCILRNLGRKELSSIMDEESKWYCYVCSPEPLLDLITACDSVLENLEQLWNQHRKRTKADNDKSSREDTVRKHMQKDKSAFNGKENGSDNLSSGTITFSYKALKVPKELLKKTKKLVETTTGLNATFVKFIQQGLEEQGTSLIKVRHLKAFKSVLTDLKKAHSALEESLEQEFKELEQLNGNEGECEVNNGGVKPQTEEVEEPMEGESEPKEKSLRDSERSSEGEADSAPACETSLDKDIVTVPSSVPDELFEMADSSVDTSDIADDSGRSPAQARKSPKISNSTLGKSPVLEKSPIKVTKELVVKLTPVPLDGSPGSSSQKKDDEESEECEEEVMTKEASLEETEGSVPLEEGLEIRRSPRVKTTPLRRPADIKGNRKTVARPASTGDKMDDSDSDEVPAILLQTAAMTPTSPEGESNDDSPQSVKRKCLFSLKKTTPQAQDKKATKRKLKGSSSESDHEPKKELVKKATVSAKKKRQNCSDSSNYDSDLEKEIKSLSKLEAAKKGSRRSKLKKEKKEMPSGSSSVSADASKEKTKASKPKTKAQKTKKAEESSSTSSSSVEEEEFQDAASGEDSSDEQKIKHITEEVTGPMLKVFCQSSEDEAEVKSGPPLAADDDDDPENRVYFTKTLFSLSFIHERIAKKMLLAQIKASYSSGEDGSSGEEESEKDEKKKSEKKADEEGEENEEEASGSGSDSDFEMTKKTRYRHHLLRHKLSLSDKDSEDEKPAKEEKKEVKRKMRRKGQSLGCLHNTLTFCDLVVLRLLLQKLLECVVVDSDEEDHRPRTRSSKKAGAEDNQRSYKQKKKRRRIKVQEDSSSNDKSGSEEEEVDDDDDDDDDKDDDDDDDSKSPGKGRKKIRKIIKDDSLRSETQNALKEEEERRKRIAEREQLREKLREVIVVEEASQVTCPITTKLVLDEDEETKEPLVQVHRNLVTKLKPHQVDGVQFMWDCCCESVKKAKHSPGSGCILAHCMGLGKTLQVVTFLHTLLLCEKLNFSTALVVCPLNTVLNWLNEFSKWQEGMADEESLEVNELATVKRPQERSYMLQRWQEDGGIMIMGYEMYRNLTQGRNIKSKKLKEIFQKTLVDPGPDFVICDEGHILKNEASAISKAMNSIRTRRRVVLTGTPLQNNLIEYHCMVNFIKENLLGSVKEFRNRFINPIQNGQCADSTLSDVRVMKKRAHILYEMLAGCVQRRDYTALTKFLPPKHEYVLAVRITPIQCKLYRYYLEHFTGVGSSVEGGRGRAGTKLFQDFQMLSRIWTHPWCLQLDYISKENKGYFDEDSMEEFIASDTEESSMSLTSEEEKPKSKKNKKGKGARGGSNSEDSDSDDLEVIKEWNSRSRGGDNPEGGRIRPEPVEEVSKPTSSSGPGSPSPDWYKEFVTEADSEILEHSGKITLLFEILRMAEEVGDKVLVFSQSLISLDLIEDFLELAGRAKEEGKPEIYKGDGKWFRNIDYYRLDGSTNAVTRKKWAEDFNDISNVRGRLFLISTRAGSLGINLVAANRVIIFDASWNPSYDVQSIFRVYRFGQLKTVFVYRFLAQGTMEEKIYDRQVAKQSLSFRVVDQQQIERHFTMNELTELYTFEPDQLDDPNSEKKSKRATPMLPKDLFLAEMLHNNKDQIVGYHEHDSLLDHKEEEALSEEDRKAAWAEYEAEKKGLSMRVNMPSGSHYSHLNMGAPNAYFPFNVAALASMSNQQLEDLINQGREKVVEASNAIKAMPKETLEDIIGIVWKENPNLNEAQVQSMALGRQASLELELKRREAMYRDVLTKQQTLIMYVQKVLTNRKAHEQQMALANRANLLNQMAMQKGVLNTHAFSQLDLLNLYQQLNSALQPQTLQRVPSPTSQMRNKNPGPSQGN